jgi:hypothetical protein
MSTRSGGHLVPASTVTDARESLDFEKVVAAIQPSTKDIVTAGLQLSDSQKPSLKRKTEGETQVYFKRQEVGVDNAYSIEPGFHLTWVNKQSINSLVENKN